MVSDEEVGEESETEKSSDDDETSESETVSVSESDEVLLYSLLSLLNYAALKAAWISCDRQSISKFHWI